MFQRLFGNTPEEQLTYLQPRILLTALVIVVGLLAMLFGGSGDWFLFVGYLIIGYVIGLITFLLGAVRYIQLRLLFKR